MSPQKYRGSYMNHFDYRIASKYENNKGIFFPQRTLKQIDFSFLLKSKYDNRHV